jgi:glycosyltransferase involved in cell wall biosynthesis
MLSAWLAFFSLHRTESVLKIVYIHQYFRTPTMSGGTRSYEFARRLVSQGHTVHVITSDTEATQPSGTSEWRVTKEAGATVHWAPVPYGNTMNYRQRIAAFSRFARVARQRASAINRDLVFATSTPLLVAIPGVLSARSAKVPFVLEVRDVWPEVPIALGALPYPPLRWAAQALEGWAYRNAAHVVALSPDMAASIRTRHPRTAVTVIPNACDTDIFAATEAEGKAVRASTPWLGGRPMVLYAGTLGIVNGVSFLVRMAARLQHVAPEVRVVVIGTGREEEKVRGLARSLGVLDVNLFMLGPVPKAEIGAWFGACDLACSTVIDVPELAANSANKVFDTWASGRPVAVNHGGWIADVIAQTGAGLVWDAGSPASAAEATAAFLGDPDQTAAARFAARELADGRFSRDKLFTDLERVLVNAVRRQ